jgi:hypothetical protein
MSVLLHTANQPIVILWFSVFLSHQYLSVSLFRILTLVTRIVLEESVGGVFFDLCMVEEKDRCLGKKSIFSPKHEYRVFVSPVLYFEGCSKC